MCRTFMGELSKWLTVTSCLTLAGCLTPPEDIDYSFELSGEYNAIADCAYIKFRNEFTDWSKAELTSRKTVQLYFGNGSATVSTIDFIDAGPNRTRVEARQRSAIYGKDFHRNRQEPLIRACALS